MTIIKSLTAKGFKSFAKKTELLFGDNFNVILGPNGSGKSNIADAVCFVLGKISAKSMRAEKSANLIFNGGKKGQPSKEAEVSIVFDNSQKEFPFDDKEIKVSRTIKGSGNSVYRVGDKIVTRQETLELLSKAKIDPDGYNIILQGDIVRFMEMKPMERREIIEQVSGISIYEDKKQKALNDLNKVLEKLNEANIILTERDTYLKELRKERDQALKYRELEEDIKRSKATYIKIQINEKQSKKDELESKIKKSDQEIGTINKTINGIKQLIQNKKKEIDNINKEIEEKGEVEQKKLHEDIETLKTDLVKNSTRKDNLESEIEKITNRKVQLEKNLKETKEKIQELSQEKTRLEKEQNLLNQESKDISQKFEKIMASSGFKDNNLEGIEKQIDEAQIKINSLKEKELEFLRKKDQAEFQLKNTSISDKDLESIKKAREEFKKTTIELSKIQRESSVIQSQLANLRQKYLTKNEELARLKTREISITELAVTDISIKRILELKDKGIYGTVSSLGKVNNQYSLALRVAAGGRIKSVVVDSDKVAEKCISYLKNNKLGVLTFLPLNKIKSRPTIKIPNIKGVYGSALDLIEFDSRFKDVFNYVFGSTIVLDNLNTARSIGIGTARMVTLDGTLLETSGAMIGGHRKPGVGFKQKEVSSNLNKLQEEVNKIKETIDTLEKRRLENENLSYELKQKKADLEGEIIKFEKIGDFKDLKELKSKSTNLAKELAQINKEFSKLNSELKDSQARIEKFKATRESIKEKMQKSKPADLDKIEQEKERVSNKLTEIRTNIKNIEMQITSIYQKEEEKAKKIIEDQEKEKQEFIQQLKEIKDLIQKQNSALKQNQSTEKKFYSNFKGMFSKRNKLNEEINKKDTEVIRQEEKIKGLEYRKNSFSLDKAKVTAELEGLNKEFEDFVEIKLKKGLSLEELKYNIKNAESSLNRMGNVNLRALEVYKDIEVEYQKIVDKVEKLKLERQDVLDLMQEIDSKKKALFMKTYNEISSNFKRIFQELSTKGTAHMELEEPETIFDAGLDIKVRIIGNKFLDIRSLSGGEKTMAALAFLFAIQEYSPSAFYFFDEVDAALDKTNSALMTKLFQKYARNSQYIVISHNDTVISDADMIYGVSMQDSISKVVSLKI